MSIFEMMLLLTGIAVGGAGVVALIRAAKFIKTRPSQ